MFPRRAAAVLLAASAVAGASWGWFTAPSRVSVRVDGNVHDGSMSWARFVEVRAERLGARELHLRVDGAVYTFSHQALGYELDREVLDRAFEVEKERGAPWAGLVATEAPELPVRLVLDEERARGVLESLARAVRREPVDAQVIVRERRVVQAQPGLELDVEQTLRVLRGLTPVESTLVAAAVIHVEPRVTDEMVLPIDVSKVLAVFETEFRNKAGARAVNIARAAELLDQTVIGPGETFSFNRTVGTRTHDRGFVDAPVIVNDEMEKDVGGGICQVASTLHAAAVYGNMEIVRRRSHSRPSGYAPLGLDATVIDGAQDFRFKNPYDTPILLHAYLPSKHVIRIEFLGRESESKVEHRYTVSETAPYSRRIWRRNELAPGKFEKKQEGSQGYEVMSTLTVRHPSGEVERRTYPSRYYPVPEVFWVSSDFDLSKLPPLPKGVTEVVVDGQALGSESGAQADAADRATEHETDSGSFDVL